MRIVVATHELVGHGGSEVYALTAADHLQRLGHDVWLHAPELGASAERAVALGVRTVAEAELPDDPAVLLVQDGVVAYALADRYPSVPQVFVAHSDIFDLQLPPQLPGPVAAVVTLYDRVDRRVRALGLELPVVRLPQPVDVERFKPVAPLQDRPRTALLLGNYVYGQRLAMVQRACARAQIELLHFGAHGSGATASPWDVLNRADVVFGKARVIHEAMACGRAAYVFDHNGGEGWVTQENVAALAADNFGGQSHPIAVDEDRLVADLGDYDPAMGLVNRDFVVARHSATKHVASLVEVLRGAAEARSDAFPADAPLRELSRLVRLYHRADALAFGLHARNEQLTARERELEAALATERTRCAEARGALAQLTATRRWRVLQRMLRPVDRLRARLRGIR